MHKYSRPYPVRPERSRAAAKSKDNTLTHGFGVDAAVACAAYTPAALSVCLFNAKTDTEAIHKALQKAVEDHEIQAALDILLKEGRFRTVER